MNCLAKLSKIKRFYSKSKSLSLTDLSLAHSPLFDKCKTQNELTDVLKKLQFLKSSEVIDAFRRTDRALFTRDTAGAYSEPYKNIPLKISSLGSTMSAPSHHARLAEVVWESCEGLLKKESLKITQLGVGSGYLSVLFANLFVQNSICSKILFKGTEAVVELRDVAEENVGKLFYNERVEFKFELCEEEEERVISDSMKKADLIFCTFALKKSAFVDICGSLKEGSVFLSPVEQVDREEQVLTLWSNGVVSVLDAVLCKCFVFID